MREIRQSGSEGGVAHTRHPYPYFSAVPAGLLLVAPVGLFFGPTMGCPILWDDLGLLLLSRCWTCLCPIFTCRTVCRVKYG